jgi:hypothetical protein
MIHILVHVALRLLGQLTVFVRLPHKRKRQAPRREPEIASPVPTTSIIGTRRRRDNAGEYQGIPSPLGFRAYCGVKIPLSAATRRAGAYHPP